MPTPPIPGALAEHARPAGDWPAPRLVPTSYPGLAPDHAYVLVGDEVLPLSVDGDTGGLALTLPDGSPLDALLDRCGAAPVADRVPMLAYGANRCPQTLAVKFAHHARPVEVLGPLEADAAALAAAGASDGPGRDAVVPVLAGTLADVDVVGVGLSSQGYIYADLTPSPGTQVQLMVTLLDRHQATAVHRSEGIGAGIYECAWLSGYAVAGCDVVLDVLAYAGGLPVFVSPATGTPLAFSAIAASGRRFPAFDQVDLLAHVLDASGVLDEVADLVGLGLGVGDGSGEPSGSDPVRVARELARLLSGQWWYAHNTGDAPMGLASRAQAAVWEAWGRNCATDTTARCLADDDRVVASDDAYACGPALLLSAQLPDLGR